MRIGRIPLVALAFGALAVGAPVYAHHGTAQYDYNKTITLNGTITQFEWGNPHCLVHMDVKADTGGVQRWTLELPSTFTMSRKGWTKASLKEGDQVSADTHPARNGTPLGISWAGNSIMKIAVDGKPLPSK